MILDFNDTNTKLTVIREPNDPKFYSESSFWYYLKNFLNNRWNSDLIKKLMYKDGHMTSQYIYYLRDRKWKYCIHDDQYCLRFVCCDFNKKGEVILNVVWWED